MQKIYFFVSMYKRIKRQAQLVLMNLLFMDIKCLDIGMNALHIPRSRDGLTPYQHFQISP